MYTKAMPLPFLPPPAALTVQKEKTMASRGCFGCPGGRLAPEAAIHILARRGGHLPPRGRLDA